MPIPFHLIGLALTGSIVISKTRGTQRMKGANFRQNNDAYRTRQRTIPPIGRNPIAGIIKSINNITKQLSNTIIKENLTDVIKSFLPPDAELIAPQYPLNSKTVFTADLDGDTRDELFAAYTYNNEIWMLILKKVNEKWEVHTKLKNTEFDTINYIGFADIKGAGKKDILIGWNTKNTYNQLDILSLENTALNVIDQYEYSRLEVTDFSGKNQKAVPAEVAVWTKTIEGSYAIDVLSWDGQQLSPKPNPVSYYRRSVVPFYMQRIRSSNATPLDWYHLSDALFKAEAYNDVLISTKIGMELDKDKSLTRKFAEIEKAAINKF